MIEFSVITTGFRKISCHFKEVLRTQILKILNLKLYFLYTQALYEIFMFFTTR